MGLYGENNRPYEIFTGKEVPPFVFSSNITKGKIIKNKKDGQTQYDFSYIDVDKNKDKKYTQVIEGLSRTFDPVYWNYAKLISGLLRHGMPMANVVDVINGLNMETDTLNSWQNGVQRLLKKFIANNTKLKKSKCPQCDDDDGLRYSEGCITCASCGYSKCG